MSDVLHNYHELKASCAEDMGKLPGMLEKGEFDKIRILCFSIGLRMNHLVKYHDILTGKGEDSNEKVHF